MICLNRKGFSLIEVLIVMVIVGVILKGSYNTYINFNKNSVVQEQIAEMQQNVRVSSDQITRELRASGYRFGSPIVGVLGSSALPSITLDKDNPGNSVTIQGDFDNNNVAETVIYSISCFETPCTNPWLMRNYNGEGAERFAANITEAEFKFYGQNPGDATDLNFPRNVNTAVQTKASDIRRVTLKVTGRSARHDPDYADNNGYRVRTVSSDVVLRNFGASLGDTTPPSCPTTTTVTAVAGECGQLTVNWTFSNPDGDIAGFRIYYSTGAIDAIPPTPPTGTNADNGTLDVPCTGSCPSTAILTGLKSGVSYNVIVEAYDAFGNSSTCFPGNPNTDLWDTNKTSVSGIPETGPAPAAPDQVQAPLAEMGKNKVTLYWNPVTLTVDNTAEKSLKGYRVYRGTTPDFVPDDTSGTGNRLANETTVTVASFVDNTAVACTVYYYKIKAVNTCGVVSAESVALKVTPPDNAMKPKAPTITSLVAGDDTSTLIVDWLVPAPDVNTHSTPALLKVYYKKDTDTLWTTYETIDLTSRTLPATGQTILIGLMGTTVYDIKVSAIDAAPPDDCGDAADSTISSISTAACAPRIQWTTGTGIVRGGNKIYPGLTPTGTPIDFLSGRTVIGTDPNAASDPDFVPGSRYITWVVDPLDCTPDSSNFDRQGFDYSDPPTYVTVSTGAKVDFFINKAGDPTNTPADVAYGSGGASDLAPRSSDNYYHFPFYPLTSVDIDTGKFCSGDYDFRVRAVDGEQYTAENTIPLTIRTGGIEFDDAVVTTTNISTPDDTHHIVDLGIKNTHPDKNLDITHMLLKWGNTLAFLKKVEIASPALVLFEDTNLTTVPPVETGSGTVVVFSVVPTVSANGGTATLRLTFTSNVNTIPASIDMRGVTVSGGFMTRDTLDASFVCSATLASQRISQGPQFVKSTTFQDQPAASTLPSTVPTITSYVAPGKLVGLSTAVDDATANPSYSVNSVKIHYAIDAFTSTTPPTRPSSTEGGVSYPNPIPLNLGTVIASKGSWSGSIPAMSTASRVWYYLETIDTEGNFDILPETGAYTYAQCDTVGPSLSFNSPPTPAAGPVSGNVDVEVTASSSVVGLQDVSLEVTGFIGIPPTTMTEISPDVYSESYQSTSGGLNHTLKVTATDRCGNKTTISRIYNP